MEFHRVLVILRTPDNICHDYSRYPFIADLRIEQNQLVIDKNTGSVLNCDYWIVKFEEFLKIKIEGEKIKLCFKYGRLYIKFALNNNDHEKFIKTLLPHLPKEINIKYILPTNQ